MRREREIVQDLDRYFCSDCEEPCLIRMQDEGIGAYEYWGCKGVHRDWQPVSDCCGADIIDEYSGEVLTANNVEVA